MAKKAKAKKRGVKPGTKRGRYKRVRNAVLTSIPNKTWRLLNVPDLGAELGMSPIDPGPAIGTVDLTAYEQLDDMVSQLERSILNTVARIKSLGI